MWTQMFFPLERTGQGSVGWVGRGIRGSERTGMASAGDSDGQCWGQGWPVLGTVMASARDSDGQHRGQ